MFCCLRICSPCLFESKSPMLDIVPCSVRQWYPTLFATEASWKRPFLSQWFYWAKCISPKSKTSRFYGRPALSCLVRVHLSRDHHAKQCDIITYFALPLLCLSVLLIGRMYSISCTSIRILISTYSTTWSGVQKCQDNALEWSRQRQWYLHLNLSIWLFDDTSTKP